VPIRICGSEPPSASRLRDTGPCLRERVPDLLRELTFRRVWAAQTISFVGDQVSIVALPLVAALTLDASASELGVLAAVGSLPNLVFSLHAGAYIDSRGHRRETMIATDLARAGLLATVPVAYAFGDLTLYQLYAVSFAAGSLAVVFNVCSTSLFASVVPRPRFVEGTSLLRGSYSFSWVVGPSIGGAIVQALTAPAALLIDAVSFIGSASLLGSISSTEHLPDTPDAGSIRVGLRFVRGHPVLLAKFNASAVLSFFYAIYFALLFLFAARELRLPAAAIGLALGAGAVGALVGSMLTAKLSRRFGVGLAFTIGALLYPSALALVPIAPSGNAIVASCALIAAELGSGFGLMLVDIAGSSIQQALTPDRLRSRVQGASMTITAGVRPLGSLTGGLLGAAIGLRPALWIAALGGIVSLAVLLPSPMPRLRELPAEAEDVQSRTS
jgi:MFS family permease